MKKQLLCGLAVLALSTSSVVMASDADDAIEYRQGVFTAMKWHFAPMGAMVKGKLAYDAAEFQRRAELVAALAKMPQEGFVEGSDKGDTDAKAAIWENKDKFDQGMQMLVEKAAALEEAAQSGDMEQIKPAFGALAKTCKGCHDNFKED